MSVELELMRLQTNALKDENLRKKLLATKNDADPYKALCLVASEYGYDIPLFELACLGDSFCATMLRSVNGGGTESFDSWSDFYGMFFYALENTN